MHSPSPLKAVLENSPKKDHLNIRLQGRSDSASYPSILRDRNSLNQSENSSEMKHYPQIQLSIDYKSEYNMSTSAKRPIYLNQYLPKNK